MNIKHYLKRLITGAVLFGILSGVSAFRSSETTPDAVAMESRTTDSRPAETDSRQLASNITMPTAQYKVFVPLISKPQDIGWPMAGANPQRTSWVPEEVSGNLKPQWYRVIEPYIPPKVQIIAVNGMLYISTAKGLYALDAASGVTRWIFPTELPLGNSPTVINGVAYVGGLDHKLYAINAMNGEKLWTFEAKAGFDTNPLVANNMVYLGGRDGYFYAVYSNDDPGRRGTLAWKYQTGGPIHFSAASDVGNRTIYFASNDSYAYALDALTGDLVWKSAKLPTAGFHSWWPVVNGNSVMLSAQRPYRFLTPPLTDMNPDNDYTLTEPGLDHGFDQLQSNWTRDATLALNYLESKPWMRSYYLLNTANGQEISYDFNHNGKPEYAPLLSTGTHSGSRYPAMVMPDGRFYSFNNYAEGKYDNAVAAWTPGSNSISVPHFSGGISAWDEPVAYSGGGSLIYWNQCCDRAAGAYTMGGTRYSFFGYNLSQLIPGYNVMTTGSAEANAVTVFGDWNGVYGYHGDQNPPIPYRGRVYMHRSNAVIAFSISGGAQQLPRADTVAVQTPLEPVDVNVVQQRLESEVQKMVQAGHLRPGFGLGGAFSAEAANTLGDNLTDYWHNSLDTILVLTRAYPHLSSSLQQQVRTYLQNELTNYGPCDYTHVGWSTGAARESFDLPPEVTGDMPDRPPTRYGTWFAGWTGPDWVWTPHTFYALWKYAQTFGNARALFDNCKNRMQNPPSDTILAQFPFAHNAWIAGLWGYLQLQQLAGYAPDSAKQATLNRLLALRVSAFNKDNPWGPDSHNWGQALAVARNFIYMTPELGQYLHDHALTEVQTAFDSYVRDAPYWFVTNFEATYNEITLEHLYDYNALFSVKSMIFHNSREELARYLDVPGFARGDLFYIQNLVDTLEAPSVLNAGSAPSRESATKNK